MFPSPRVLQSVSSRQTVTVSSESLVRLGTDRARTAIYVSSQSTDSEILLFFVPEGGAQPARQVVDADYVLPQLGKVFLPFGSAVDVYACLPNAVGITDALTVIEFQG